MMVGRMTERVTVQARTLNASDTPIETWAAVPALTRIAASVETTSGARVERVFGAQLQAQTSHVVAFPMPAEDVALTSRVVWHSRWGDRTLAIVGKVQVQDARTRWLTLACEEDRTP